MNINFIYLDRFYNIYLQITSDKKNERSNCHEKILFVLKSIHIRFFQLFHSINDDSF